MRKDIHCIYCPEVAASLEHPLPAAFGEFEGAPLLENRICKKCNERLGILDEQFTRSGREGFFRKLYGIQGRSSHDKINSFERGSAGGHRLEMRGVDPQLGFEVGLEYVDGVPRQLRQIVFVEPSGNAHHLPIRIGTTPAQLLAAFRARNITGPAESFVFCDPAEQEWVEALISKAWPSVAYGPGRSSSTSYENVTVRIEVSDRYFRAIAKIGFHYFLTQFPDYRGDETIFSELRDYIMKDRGSKIGRANDFIGIRQTPLLANMLNPMTRPDGWRGHVLCAEVTPSECFAYLLTFLSEDIQPEVRTVKLASDSSLTETRAAGHAYCYFVDGPRGKFSGEAHSLEISRSDTPPAPPAPIIG